MKTIFLLFTVLANFLPVFSQVKPLQRDIRNYVNLQPGHPGSGLYRLELTSDTDPAWDKWQLRGYNFGFDPGSTPMYTTVNGILATPYMIQVRGNANEKNMKRWGYHLFEGYASDDLSRVTLLVNKHVELDRPVTELYYFGTEYNHSNRAYNWVRIGSDVKNHSYLFSRDEAVFYGSLKLKNVMTLGNLGKDELLEAPPAGDDEQNAVESAKNVNYESLKNGGDGTIFYDKDHDIVVIKIAGEWRKLATEPLPEGVEYEF